MSRRLQAIVGLANVQTYIGFSPNPEFSSKGIYWRSVSAAGTLRNCYSITIFLSFDWKGKNKVFNTNVELRRDLPFVLLNFFLCLGACGKIRSACF